MKKERIAAAAAAVMIITILTACGENAKENRAKEPETSDQGAITFLTPEVKDGTINIDTSLLSDKEPLYINYDANGTMVQMIAVKASDGTDRVSLNTCQSCNPSPKAFFQAENGLLVCQNCGNRFRFDAVGSEAGGCNPMPIAYEAGEGTLRVKADELEQYADRFTSWGGRTE